MKKFTKLLESIQYQYGIAMGKIENKQWGKILNIIDKDDVFIDESTKGLEDEPHVTILYGLHKDVDCKEVSDIFKDINKINYIITECSIFENEKYDVLKFGVESNELIILNKWLMSAFEYTTNYPDYKAHITIAYIKKGEAKKYIDIIEKDFLQEMDIDDLKINEVIVSIPEQDKKVIKLK